MLSIAYHALFICALRLCAPHGHDDNDEEGDDNDASVDDDNDEGTRLLLVAMMMIMMVMMVMKAHNSEWQLLTCWVARKISLVPQQECTVYVSPVFAPTDQS